MAIPRPVVRGDQFTFYAPDGTLMRLTLDSPEWARWADTHRYFRYEDFYGGFTARKYKRIGWGYRHRATGRYVKRAKPSRDPDLEFLKRYTWWYWYAFRTIRLGDDLFTWKAYIGRHPSPDRLQKASIRLTQKISAWALKQERSFRIGMITYPVPEFADPETKNATPQRRSIG